MTTSTVVQILEPAWWAEARAVARHPRYAAAAGDPARFDRLVKGLVAERAVIDHLVCDVVGPGGETWAASWLSDGDQPREYQHLPHRLRPHAGDICWRGEELDVKLINRQTQQLMIKAGAQHLHHVFVTWHKHLRSIELLGVLLKHQPETFEPARPLCDATGQTYSHLIHADRAVNGWWIPRCRLQPLETLL